MAKEQRRRKFKEPFPLNGKIGRSRKKRLSAVSWESEIVDDLREVFDKENIPPQVLESLLRVVGIPEEDLYTEVENEDPEHDGDDERDRQ